VTTDRCIKSGARLPISVADERARQTRCPGPNGCGRILRVRPVRTPRGTPMASLPPHSTTGSKYPKPRPNAWYEKRYACDCMPEPDEFGIERVMIHALTCSNHPDYVAAHSSSS
jgi:hypothetical protein